MLSNDELHRLAGEHRGGSTGIDFELALSEAGSIEELRSCQSMIAEAAASGNAGNALDPVTRKLLQDRALEREGILEAEARQRLQNQLSVAPFHASANATSSTVVDHMMSNPTVLDAAAPPLPAATTSGFVTLLSALAEQMDPTTAPARHMRECAVNIAAALKPTPTVAMSRSWHVGILGRRGCGRGALFQCLTGAGLITDTDFVGIKVLPVIFVHSDAVDTPTIAASEVQRIWLPIKAQADSLIARKPHLASLMFTRPDSKAVHSSISTTTSDVRGEKQIAGLVRYASEVLLALFNNGEAVDAWLLNLLSASGGVMMGPPRVQCRFPWLRGVNVQLTVADIPLPDAPAPVLEQTLSFMMSRAGTVVLVDKPRWELDYSQACVTSHADPMAGTAVADPLWRLLRDFVTERSRHAALSTAAGLHEGWDSDAPTPLLVVLLPVDDPTAPAHLKAPVTTTPASPMSRAGVDRWDSAIAPTATEYHLWVARHKNITIEPQHVFVVATQAANAVIELHDAMTGRRNAEQDSLRVNAAGEVTILLNQVKEAKAWTAIFNTDVADDDGVVLPQNLCDLATANESVWRLSRAGLLIRRLLVEAVGCFALPEKAKRLCNMYNVASSALDSCVEALVNPLIFTPESVKPEVSAVNALRDAIAAVRDACLAQKAHIELLVAENDEGHRTVEPQPSAVRTVVQDLPFKDTLNAALDTASGFKEDAAKKLFGTRLSLASAIRTKVAAVTTMAAGKSSADTARSAPASVAAPASSGILSNIRQPPAIAFTAVKAIGSRAAAALQGTDTDTAVVAEKLRSWWCSLAETSRVGQSDGTTIVFRVNGEECVLRLCFGLTDLAERFADNTAVIGNFEVEQCRRTLHVLCDSRLLDAAIAGKAFRTFPPPLFSPFLPPKPAAAIAFSIHEHAQRLAPQPNVAPPTCLLVVDDIDKQVERELRANLGVALTYGNECAAALDAFQRIANYCAAASTLARVASSAPDIVLPYVSTAGNPLARWYPISVAFVALANFVATVSDALGDTFHILSAALSRPDDSVCHLSLPGSENASRILHSVSRSLEFRAEWRRWRSAYFKTCTAALRQPLPALVALVQRAPEPLRVGLVNADQPGSRNRSLDFLVDATSSGSPDGSIATSSVASGIFSARPRMPAWQQQGRKKAVLCLCGGGVRGVLSALFVQRIDTIVQRLYSVAGKKKTRIWDVCDEFYGTSTGAIVAALLTIGIEPSAIVNLYKDCSSQIFPPSTLQKVAMATKPKYDPNGRLEVARRYMGRRVMNDQAIYAGIARPKILLCDLSNLKTKVADCYTDMPFVDALMAATAAPTYFPAHKIGATFYCDAGIAENHPGLEVAKDLHSVSYVCTIGTGVAPTNYSFLNNAGLLQWGPVFADVFIDATQTAADDVLKAIFGDRSDLLNLTLPPVKMELDDANTIPVLVELAHQYMRDNEAVFVKVAQTLYANTIGWRSAAEDAA